MVTPQPLTELYSELIAVGQQLQLNLEMSRTSRRKNLVVILYSHVLSLFLRAIQETEDGHLAEASSAIYELVDAAFATVAAIRDPGVTQLFYQGDVLQRIYHRNATQALPRDISGRIRAISGLALAERAGMTQYFKSMGRVLRRNAVCAGRLPGEPAPAADDAPRGLLVPACEGMLLAARQVADYFGIHELDKEFYEPWTRYSALAGTTGKADAQSLESIH